MQQCLIYNSSLRFSRAFYGVMTLIAFITHNQWLVLITGVLMLLGVFSLKLNISYQLHVLVIKKLLNEKSEPEPREKGEINFVAGMTGVLLLFGFSFIYFNKFVDFAWIYILIVALLIFVACFAGFCVATLMYVLLRKLIIKNQKR